MTIRIDKNKKGEQKTSEKIKGVWFKKKIKNMTKLVSLALKVSIFIFFLPNT